MVYGLIRKPDFHDQNFLFGCVIDGGLKFGTFEYLNKMQL